MKPIQERFQKVKGMPRPHGNVHSMEDLRNGASRDVAAHTLAHTLANPNTRTLRPGLGLR